METISIEIYIMIRSIDETIRKRPNVIIPKREKYSPLLYSSNSPEYRLTIDTNIVAKMTINLKKEEKGSKTIASVNNVVIRNPF